VKASAEAFTLTVHGLVRCHDSVDADGRGTFALDLTLHNTSEQDVKLGRVVLRDRENRVYQAVIPSHPGACTPELDRAPLRPGASMRGWTYPFTIRMPKGPLQVELEMLRSHDPLGARVGRVTVDIANPIEHPQVT
jgi:hypothetical protein